MNKLSKSQLESLAEAARRYWRSMPKSPAEEFLETRGLARPEVGRFHLGYVENPLPGHEMYRGMLAIPYLRRTASSNVVVVSIRFRCIEEGCKHPHHGKYNTASGDTGRLFNTDALQGSWPAVGLSEGEIDAITATICGIPTVGIPGATVWEPYWREPFLGFETVFVFADGDKAGAGFADKIARKLPNAKVIPSAPGEDVNSEYLQYGKSYLRRKVEP